MKDSWNQSIAKLKLLFPHLNEKQKRLFAAAESEVMGPGAISCISVQVGISRNSIQKGLSELHREPSDEDLSRIRKKGAGRKSIQESQPGIKKALLEIVNPVTRGDPEAALLWTSKSVAKIAQELEAQGFQVLKKN